MAQIIMKSNFIISLEQCVRNFSDFIANSSNTEESKELFIKAIECREMCLACIGACESADLNTRGQLMYNCRVLCNEFLSELKIKNNSNVIMLKCAESCNLYIEECGHLFSD